MRCVLWAMKNVYFRVCYRVPVVTMGRLSIDCQSVAAIEIPYSHGAERLRCAWTTTLWWFSASCRDVMLQNFPHVEEHALALLTRSDVLGRRRYSGAVPAVVGYSRLTLAECPPVECRAKIA